MQSFQQFHQPTQCCITILSMLSDSNDIRRYQQQIDYDIENKAQFYVSAVTDSISDPSHLVTYYGGDVGKYCNGGNRLRSLESRLTELKQEYVNDRSKPTRVLKWPTSEPQYSIICKSQNHVVRGFNEAVRDQDEDA